MSLVCEENFGSGTLTDRTAGQALAAIVAGERDLLLLGRALPVGIAGDLARQRAAETGEMRATVALRDVVGEAERVLVIAVVPPHGDLDDDVVALGLDGDRSRDERVLGPIEVANEGFEAALIHQLLSLRLDAAPVGEDDLHAGIEEGEFAQTVLERGVVEVGLRERRRRRQEGDLRAIARRPVSDHLQRRVGDAVGEGHLVNLAVAPDAELQLARQGVDHRDTDAVEAAGDLVGVLVEFSAGMELGHDDLGGGHALPLVNVGGDAAAVVPDRRRAVGVEGDA